MNTNGLKYPCLVMATAFFFSIAYCLKSQHDNSTYFCPTYFKETTLSDVQNLLITSKELRKLMVEEIRSHSDEYSSFVIVIDVLKEAEKFLKYGVS